MPAILAVGAGGGHLPRVQVHDAQTQELVFDFLAFSRSFRGGVNVAVGDVNGDGTPDIVAAVASGAAPRVKVFDGTTGAPLPGPLGSFLAFSANSRSGVNVAVGDVDGDGLADIIAGAGAGASPRVKVFSGADGSVLADFLAFEASFRGGVRVSTGDFRHRQAVDLILGAGPGRTPRVKIVAGDTQETLADFAAFADNFRGGVFVGSGDLNHDGTIDLIVGSGNGGRGQVKAFDGLTNALIVDFRAASASYTGAVRVDGVDGDGDGFEDILAGLSTSRAPRVKVFDGQDGTLLQSFTSHTADYLGAASIAGAVPRGRGANFELTAPVTVEIPVLERLARYVPIDLAHPKGQFVPVTAGSVAAGKNVYFIAHGWAPGYRDWVNKYLNATPQHVLKWWETAGYGDGAQYPPPDPSPGPDSVWLYDAATVDGVEVSPPGGLAEQIMKADPNAVVFAYSWIDDSATTSALDNHIPEQAYLSEALTNINGARLATAVRQLLGDSYSGQIHLLGHSHGSKVATLAALALKQHGGVQARQLTIFDSPESDLTDDGNASNFLWHYFQQLNPTKEKNSGLFIDSYFSAFGEAYATMQIGGATPLGNVVDTQLYAYPYSFTWEEDAGHWHGYPPSWYAAANAVPNTNPSYTNGGLAWSPLLGGDPSTIGPQWEQSWSAFSPTTATQAGLEATTISAQSVAFDGLTIKNAQTGQAVSSISLGLGAGQTRTFKGTYGKDLFYSGIAFDYSFSGADVGLLKIQINDYLAYYIDSRYLPQGVTQHVTINIGWPSLTHNITVALMPPPGVLSTAQVTLSNFTQFDVSS